MSKEEVLAALTRQIGQEVQVGEWLTVTQDRIDRFAEATGDHQWIHVEPERARRESPFGDTVAHGYLTLSLVTHLLTPQPGEADPYRGCRLLVNYGLNKVRFPTPVKVNSRIRARRTLKAIEDVGPALQMLSVVTVDIEGQDKPACVAEALRRMYF
ncbi:MAG: MaoC family dehydratase [Deltaproteobacteria bacterium]|nr:MaoC family dehydratase [Deltaproteobacteria bacterium]